MAAWGCVSPLCVPTCLLGALRILPPAVAPPRRQGAPESSPRRQWPAEAPPLRQGAAERPERSRCHSDAAAMAAPGPTPLLPAEAEALVQALRGTELRDTGGQGCGGPGLSGEGPGPACLAGEHEERAVNLGCPCWGCMRWGERSEPVLRAFLEALGE